MKVFDNMRDVDIIHLGALIVAMLLSLASVIIGVCYQIAMPPAFSPAFVIWKAMGFVLFVITAVYVLVSYKTPHGNLMKYIFLSYALYVAMAIAATAIGGTLSTIKAILLFIIMISATFLGGRLNKINENLGLFIVVVICGVIYSFMNVEDYHLGFVYGVMSFDVLVFWIDITLSYMIRYRPHKAAGYEADIAKGIIADK